MAEVTESAIRKVLETVIDPASGASVPNSGLLGGIAIRGGHVAITLDVDPARGTALEPLRQACEQAVRAMPGVLSATAVMTAERAAPPPPPAPGRGQGRAMDTATATVLPAKTTGGGGRIDVPGVKHIIAVASGKGGVGKSTTAVNLALGLAANGIATGLLDADIYGPSMPRMLGVTEKPDSADGKMLKPIERYGLRTMSIGYIVNEDTPMIWRGPMVSSALEQMLRDVQWGELDVLVVDMPPGTGDAQLTLAQRVAAGRRGDRVDAAGHRAGRRAQGPQHVPQGGRAGARHRREHELLPLPQVRRARRRSSATAAPARRRRSSACRSWARCRCISTSARLPTAAVRS